MALNLETASEAVIVVYYGSKKSEAIFSSWLSCDPL
jgi:hypothetical protein